MTPREETLLALTLLFLVTAGTFITMWNEETRRTQNQTTVINQSNQELDQRYLNQNQVNGTPGSQELTGGQSFQPSNTTVTLATTEMECVSTASQEGQVALDADFNNDGITDESTNCIATAGLFSGFRDESVAYLLPPNGTLTCTDVSDPTGDNQCVVYWWEL